MKAISTLLCVICLSVTVLGFENYNIEEPVIEFSEGENGGRIIGGEDATRGQIKWMAVVVSKIGGVDQLYCGGSLISEDYVITAAQCVPPESDLTAEVRVVLGALNITSTTETGRVDLISDFRFVHPEYDSVTKANDIAIVHLPRRVFSSRESYDYEVNATYDGVGVRMSGWGADKDGIQSNYSEILRYVDTLVRPLQVCIDYYGVDYVNEKHICVSTAGGHGPCKGDTGAPLTLTEPSADTHQIGIFSFYDDESCIRGKPVVFTKLASHWDFITDYTGLLPLSPPTPNPVDY